MYCHTEPRWGAGFFGLIFVLLVAPDSAWPASDPVQEPQTRFAPETGMVLRHRSAESLTLVVPSLRTDVAIAVSGIIARVTVRQTFRNPDDVWVEGIYGFPLPDDAAVDTLRMQIGERVVEGEIREREQARQLYDEARRVGQRASLIEQERPNLFTASAANIPPKGEIVVEIGYQQRLRFADGDVSLRFPSVIAPRYIPGNLAVAGVGGMGWATNTDQVRDAERISPLVRHPDDGPGNALTLTVRLDAGMPLAFLRSPSHELRVTESAQRYAIEMKSGNEVANRDFVLNWRPDTGGAPFTALFTEEKDGEIYLMAIVAPPSADVLDAPRFPREVVFLIDTSGSMSGESLNQAKAALRFALRRLKPGDRFNILQFANDSTALFAVPRLLDGPSRNRAFRFINSLGAEGGTEIGKALQRVLDGRIGMSYLRQVVLVTDGAIGNEAALFSRIRRDIGDSRLFTVGIGSAPNSYFMRKAAEQGRGTFTHIGATGEVAEVMSRLFEKLERPALTQIAAHYDGENLPATIPAPLPDLYHGEPVVLTAKLPWHDGEIAFEGRLADRAWRQILDLADAREGSGIAKLWARDRIGMLADQRFEGLDEDEIRSETLKIALAHGLTSRYTSLVAVDKSPARTVGEALDRRAVPVDLPAGWHYEKVFGGQGATSATLKILTGIGALLLGTGMLLTFRRRMA